MIVLNFGGKKWTVKLEKMYLNLLSYSLYNIIRVVWLILYVLIKKVEI